MTRAARQNAGGNCQLAGRLAPFRYLFNGLFTVGRRFEDRGDWHVSFGMSVRWPAGIFGSGIPVLTLLTVVVDEADLHRVRVRINATVEFVPLTGESLRVFSWTDGPVPRTIKVEVSPRRPGGRFFWLTGAKRLKKFFERVAVATKHREKPVASEIEPDPHETDRQLAAISQELRHIRILLTCLLILAVLSAATSVGGYLIDTFLPFIFWIGLGGLVAFALYYGVKQLWKSRHNAADK